MANGEHTFKHSGQTYGKEMIFSATEARSETYNAFGQEKNFLGKLLKMGFMLDGDYVYHPTYWVPVPRNPEDNPHARRFKATGTGRLRNGTRPDRIRGRRR